MAFFDYRQNNSGGSFDIDPERGISVSVVVEAQSAFDADIYAESIGLYFDGRGDCSCCGDRWSEAYGEGDAVPSLYGEPVESHEPFMKWAGDRPEGFIHYLDGRIVPFGV